MICSVFLLIEYGYATIKCWGWNSPDGLENKHAKTCGTVDMWNYNGEFCASYTVPRSRKPESI